MKLNKIKYFGICATTLLTVTPIATSAVTLAARPATISVVQAATSKDERYQDSLNSGFKSNVNLTVNEIGSLVDDSIKGNLDSGVFSYSNVGDVASNTAVLFNNGSGAPSLTAVSDLKTCLNDDFLKLFTNDNATVGYLPNTVYKTKVSVTGTKLSSPTSAANMVQQLKTLKVGDKFSVSLTTVNANGDTVGSKTVNVTLSNTPAKLSLAPVADLTATSGQSHLSTQNATDNAAVIKNSRGEQVFKASDLSSFAVNNPYYYAINSSSTYTAATQTSKYELPNGADGVIYTQLIPVPYTETISKTYEASSFVFLDSNHKVTTTAPTPSDSAVAYVKRSVKVGNINSSAYPVFKYSFSGSSIPTYKNGEAVTLNSSDKAKLTYKYNDTTSFNTMKTFVEGNFKNNSLKAYQSVDENDAGKNEIQEISFTFPDIKSSSSSQFVIATVTNTTNGVTSSIKIPVVVTDIPKPLSAPTVTAFPSNAINVESKTTKSIDPLNNVKATYVGTDGSTKDVPKSNIQITVKDANDKDVALNSDGSVPTTTNGTYKITYVFSNPDDVSKTITKTLTLNVSETSLSAPTVNGVNESTTTLSNVNRKSINPFDALLKNNKIDASYVGLDGKSHAIDNSKVKVTVTDSNNKEIKLNSDGTIPMDTAGTYKINYIFANGDDATKTTTKSSSLVVNSLKTDMPVANYNDGTSNSQNPTINKQETSSFDPMAGLKFTYNTSENTSDAKSDKKDIDSKNISISVTKDGKEVKLGSDGKLVVESGVYTIKYTVVNPVDNSYVLSYTRTLTVKDEQVDKTEITQESGVVYINYVWGYGVNVWKDHNTTNGAEQAADGSLRKLMTGTGWKYDQIAKNTDGSVWYRVGKNQWIQGEYASSTQPVNPNDWKISDVEGVGTINYVPGYGVNLWTSPDTTNWTRKLNHGTAWKYFKIAKKDGKVMYNLGGDQWVDGQYFK